MQVPRAVPGVFAIAADILTVPPWQQRHETTQCGAARALAYIKQVRAFMHALQGG